MIDKVATTHVPQAMWHSVMVNKQGFNENTIPFLLNYVSV